MSSFFKPTEYNNETKNGMWMSIISDAHDSMCGCCSPFTHLLDSIFPEGHADRNKTIEAIIARDKQCLSGGGEEERIGMPLGASAATMVHVGEEDIKPEEEDIDALLAAAADAAEGAR